MLHYAGLSVILTVMDSVEADAKLKHYTVQIHRGVTLDGIDWIVVIQNKLAEFRCGPMVYDYIDIEDGLIIVSVAPNIPYYSIQDAVEDILYT